MSRSEKKKRRSHPAGTDGSNETKGSAKAGGGTRKTDPARKKVSARKKPAHAAPTAVPAQIPGALLTTAASTAAFAATPTGRPWTVAPDRLANQSDTDLKPVLRRLLTIESRERGCDMARVWINAEDRAADGGADAYTPQPETPSTWLGDRPTCWQFKAGRAGEPARIRGEIANTIPAETLRKGGRFVLVASASNNGVAGRNDRLAVLVDDAVRAGLPTEFIDVFTSETLSTWLDEHPPLAGEVRGFPSGVSSIVGWEAHPHHQLAWHASDEVVRAIESLQHDLDPVIGAWQHVHLFGHPGVGKTRFALEVCRGARWRDEVLYVDAQAVADIDGLLNNLVAAPMPSAVVVIDDVEPSQVHRWNGIVARATKQLRLLTIGPQPSPDTTRIAERRVEPLDQVHASALIGKWHPDLPREHCEFAASFSAGYARLAYLTAAALKRDRNLDIHRLLETSEIRMALEAILGPAARRRSLYVVAALDSVGWESERAVEGRAIAEYLGIPWAQVRADVDEAHRAHGIAPRAGRLRQISPPPLGALIAAEAWQAEPELMKSLYSVLPTEEARSAYEARIRSIATTPYVRSYAREELADFFSASALRSEADVRRWRALGHAAPREACRLIRAALEQAPVEDRRAIVGGARRHLVWALLEFARRSDCFHDATLALAHLAAAENETYANNATGEFIRKFQIFLGGTAAPYAERTLVIDELLRLAEPYRVLAVCALAKAVASVGEFGTGIPSDGPAPVQPEWRPVNAREYADIIGGALERLTKIASEETAPSVLQELVKVGTSAAMLLRNKVLRELASALLRTIAARSSEAREELWRNVYRVVVNEEMYWKQLAATDLEWVRQVLKELEDSALLGRIRRVVSTIAWNDGPTECKALAAELVASPGDWPAAWAWLTSGKGVGGWVFGQALGRADDDGRFLRAVESQPLGPDVRPLAAYLTERGKTASDGWIDAWIDRFAAQHPELGPVVAELTWRSAPTARGVARVIELVRHQPLPSYLVEQLSYGGWGSSVPADAFMELLHELQNHPEYRGAAVSLIEDRAKQDPAFWAQVRPLALELVQDPVVVRASPNFGYYWHCLAERLVEDHPREIARGILAAHAARDEGSGWFLDHATYSAPMLHRCIELDGEAVWDELRPHLERESDAHIYVIGLPDGLIDRMPQVRVLEWVQEDATIRGALAVKLAAKALADDSLFVQLIERFGTHEEIARAASAHFASGSWWGDASKYWERLADQLRPFVSRSDLPRFASWARRQIASLEEDARRDREREEEESVRRR